MATPPGSRIAAMRALTRAISCLPFSPFSMMTVPETVSPLRSADAHVRDVAGQHRRPAVRADDDAAEVGWRGGASGAQQRVLLRGMLDIAAAEVRVVLL